MNKIRLLLLLLIFIGVCAYFYLMGFDEHPHNHTIMTRMPVMLTRQSVPEYHLDFPALARDLREYSSTHNDILEQKLFPWWIRRRNDYNSKRYHDKKDTSQGIIICTGNKHFHLALVALKALELIGNELPIEVVFSTSNDLSSHHREELDKLYPKIRLIDLSSLFNDSYLELRGWEIKPFAVLASQFRHVLLMDADVLFLEKPSILFQNSFYLKTGSLFFYDRTTLSDEITQWIQTLSIDKNQHQSLPQHTQESGVVLIDKARVLDGLLSTCKLNDHQERERVTYRHLYGDKDTWWLGFHIIQMPYSFIPTLTAAIGQIMNTGQYNKVCGHILHLDENYRPIWWNGGLFKNRYIDVRHLLNIEGWLYEGHWTLMAYSCMTGTGQPPKRFSQYQEQLINGYISITRQVFSL
jgi:hypothetical protein